MLQHLPWEVALEQLEFAFQPIVDPHTGSCYGYEALLRGWERAGFESIFDVFDSAHAELHLHAVELALREKAISAFVEIGHFPNVRLFYNVDGRVLDMPDYQQGRTREVLEKFGLEADALCLEISERHDVSGSDKVLDVLQRYRSQMFGIAIDDYGAGFSGLQMLYHAEPTFIKIDRFFIEGIARDARKRLFVSNVVSMAHVLGIRVIAEGIEADDELRVCREIGCDLVQGFFVQRPTTAIGELLPTYEAVRAAARAADADGLSAGTLRSRARRLEPVINVAPMSEVLSRFHDEQDAAFLVVVDSREEPVGILRDRAVKPYIYSPFGWALLAGGTAARIDEFITRCPVAEVHLPVEQLMQMFALGEENEEGIILTDNGRYAGFIATADLLKAVNERDLENAREQNPLSGLPGNKRIAEYVREALANKDRAYVFVYFDFDGFKAFNDVYGFRRGDRAIQLFARSLKEPARESGWFVGHVGGDDFFVGIPLERSGFDSAVQTVNEIMDDFRLAVRDLYSREDLARGGVVTMDRFGAHNRHSLLDVSAAIVHAPADRSEVSVDGLGSLIAALKSSAKRSASHIATLEYDGTSETYPPPRLPAGVTPIRRAQTAGS